MVYSSLLKAINPACSDAGYTEKDPCVIYIGILCREVNGCNGTEVSLEYENNRP